MWQLGFKVVRSLGSLSNLRISAPDPNPTDKSKPQKVGNRSKDNWSSTLLLRIEAIGFPTFGMYKDGPEVATLGFGTPEALWITRAGAY